MDFTSIVIQLIAGGVGGNLAGKASPKFNIGGTGNSLAGAIGGIVVGQIIAHLSGGAISPDQAAAAAQGLDVGGLITSLIGGGAGGALLTSIIAMIKNRSA